MDLLASYASSDDDDDDRRQPQTVLPDPTSLFSSLPQPKSKSSSSSLFSSLPRPKGSSGDEVGPPSSSSRLFSTLPKPSSSSSVTPKRIVHLTPPLPPPNSLDDDDDDEDKVRKRRSDSQTTFQPPSVRSFLSSIPLPRHSSSLGAGSSSSGSARRSIIETQAEDATQSPPVPNPPPVQVESLPDAYSSYHFTGVPSYLDGAAASQETYPVAYDEAGVMGWNGVDAGVASDGVYHQDSGGSYWGIPEGAAIGGVRKRGRKEANVEIVEVKQDELMKNRPREDQMKLTGIAFGPAHQPTSTKGKPSKLHKRKHQIGSLFFDMKQKETELQERRARGLLTKSQTQGKYGW
ncbi:hypothetical protein MLD38_007252 [Melastoma candidum]|uniref:Uncharacterized protein n=1 Tax=Melastoma candidum TaxID=119954 RepID=A0ACB9RQN2_9MYRT|nr:hypothetical protein MLD38_007252 [Melastoma candidum]